LCLTKYVLVFYFILILHLTQKLVQTTSVEFILISAFIHSFVILSSSVINLKKEKWTGAQRTPTDCVILEYYFVVREMVSFRVRTNAVIKW